MIACHIRYEIVPAKVPEFEHYAKLWMALVHKFGGTHLGYFLPSEGASNIALATFLFDSLASYEAYRTASFADQECAEAFAFAEETGCIVRYERSFFRPLTV